MEIPPVSSFTSPLFHKSLKNEESQKNYSNRLLLNSSIIYLKNQLLGQYQYFQKTYFYKEKVLLFYLLNSLIKNNIFKNRYNTESFQNILNFLKNLIALVKNDLHSQLKAIQSQNCSLQCKSIEESCLSKFSTMISKIENSEQIQNFKDFFQSYSIILDIMINAWHLQKQKQSGITFMQQLGKLVQEKVNFEENYPPFLITPLKISYSNSSAYSKSWEKHILFKSFKVFFDSILISQIIETNQEKYIFFKIFPSITTSKIKVNLIGSFFRSNNIGQFYQSQQDSESQNSQIVQDQEYLRLNTKISNSCRKLSWNSCEKPLPSIQGSLLLLPKHPATSHIFTRSSSLEKGRFSSKQSTVFTSSDLFGEHSKHHRKKICLQSTIGEQQKQYQNIAFLPKPFFKSFNLPIP